MTKLAKQRKIDSWESVKEKISEISENIPDHTNALSLPYGLQNLYTISHHEPVRILLHPNMNDYDTFVTHHGKAKKFYLNLWTINHKDCAENEKIKQQKVQLSYQVKHIVYVPTHRCFVAFAMDLTLRVFATLNFNEMSRVQTSHSVLCLFYNTCRDDVLAGCLGFVMIWKFPHAQNGCLVPTQKIECPSILPEYWVIWIKADKSSGQLLMNCEEAIVILDEGTYELRYNFKIDFRHHLPFSACAFYHPSCYFITGSKDYAIKVWNTSMNQCPLVTTFNGHCNAISAIEVDVQHHLVISSSSDKTIRLWCLETLAQTFCLETGEEVQRMELMTSRRLFYQSHEHIRVYNLNHFHKLFTVLGFEIVTSRRVRSRGCPTRLLLQGEDGAIRVVSPSDGIIITTMFPLETIPETIVDYAYNPREERLYVVLSSGAILVFSTRTNPCSTYELWKSQNSEDKVVCVAMMDLEESSESEGMTLHHRLLFAGMHNGQVTLIESNELSMKDGIEAHYGKVVLLRVSQSSEYDTMVPETKYLVSSGTDCLLKIWIVVHTSPNTISLEIWCVVKLSSVPQDIDMIGYTIGLVMDNNSLMTCRLKEDAVPVKNRKTGKDSISIYDEQNVETFLSVAEEKHSQSISGFSACPTLGLFATSSYDCSVKIWNGKAKLVKEIYFDESLRGVCFANSRGDLLVGFQSHISIVPLTNYLPMTFLEKLFHMTFPDDVFEDHLPFDRMLSFSYDPEATPCLPLDLHQRRTILEEQGETLRLKPVLKMPSAMFPMDNQNDEPLPSKEADIPQRRYSSSQEQNDLDEKLRKFQRSSLSRRSSAVQSPLLEEVIARITQSFSSRSEITVENSQSCSLTVLSEQLRRLFEGDDDKIPDNYWPCAPDGFIPNSVVRLKVPPAKLAAHLVPRILRGDELNEWFRNTRRKQSIEDSSQIPEDSFSPVLIDDDIEFYSIFDGYKDPASLADRKNMFEDDEEDEEEISSEDEVDLTKKWKASTKTTLDKDAMLSIVRTRQLMKERRKKVSKKPDMPVIVAEEEMEEEGGTETLYETEEKSGNEKDEEEGRPEVEIPDLLMNVMRQPWFPNTSLEGMTVDNILSQMLNVMADCAPLTYNKICNEMLAINASLGMSDSVKEKTMNLMVDNLGHPSTTVRRASIKTVMEFNYVSAQAIAAIISCLNNKSADLRNDAKKALEHLLGIKDKKQLRQLFVSLNILSPSHHPLASVPSFSEFASTFRARKQKELGGGDKEWVVDKSLFVEDWLTGPEEEKKNEKISTRDEKNLRAKESQHVTLAASILSKLKLYKKEPRLSIVDLTFDSSDSSFSSGSSMEEDLCRLEKTTDFFEELRKTKAGCKLLSRMGYTRTSINYPDDPSQSHEEQGKYEKRPPSLVMGFACNKMAQDEELGSHGGDYLPDISEASLLSIITDEKQQADLDKLLLPKIFNRMKVFRNNMRDMSLGDERRYFGGNLSIGDEGMLRTNMRHHPSLPEIRRLSRSQLHLLKTEYKRNEEMLRTKMGHHPSLPEIRRLSRSQLHLPDMADQTEYKRRISVRPAKRLSVNNEEPLIEPERRKSILRELQRYRVQNVGNERQQTDISPTLPPSEPNKRHSSLVSLPDMHISTGSLYPSCDSTQDATPDIHLPKINVYSKLAEPKFTPSLGTLVSNDIQGLVGKTVQPVQYSYPANTDYGGGVVGERLSRSMSVRVKNGGRKTELNNTSMRVLPVDPKLTVDTGYHKRGRSRYGILEVMWTATNPYEDRDEHEVPCVEEGNNTRQIPGDKQRRKKPRNLKTPPVTVKRFLNPIRNRNLVTNPFTDNTENRLKPVRENNNVNFTKKTNNSKCLTSTASCSASTESSTKSNQELKLDVGQCTFRELLDIQT